MNTDSIAQRLHRPPKLPVKPMLWVHNPTWHSKADRDLGTPPKSPNKTIPGQKKKKSMHSPFIFYSSIPLPLLLILYLEKKT